MRLKLPKANIIDNVVGVFSEQKKLQRMTVRAASNFLGNESYEGASHTKKSMQGWHTSIGDSNVDTVPDMNTLRSRGRDLVRNAPIACSAAKVLRTSVIGTGLKPTPKVKAKVLGFSDEKAQEWNDRAKAMFSAWAENKVSFDIQKKQNFYDSQAMVIFNVFAAGDIFATTPRVPIPGIEQDTRIQIIEADRVCNPNDAEDTSKITGGVEVDSNGAPVAYHISKSHPHGIDSNDVVTTQRVKAWGDKTGRQNVIHVFDMQRPDQKRGVSWLAPVITKFKQLNRYSDAEIMAAVVSGMFTVFVKKDMQGDDILEESLTEQESNAYPKVSGAESQEDADKSYRLGNGAMVGLAEGESVDFANPMRPNANYEPFVNAIYKEIGASLEIPYEILMKIFQSSYSASRAAFLEGWRAFRVKRVWMTRQYCQPIYEIWLSEAVAKGQIDAPGFFDSNLLRSAYCNCQWIGDSKGQIDPVKETLGLQMQEDRGYITAEQIAAELNGSDFEENLIQRKKEQDLRVKFGLDTKPLDPAVVKEENEKKTE